MNLILFDIDGTLLQCGPQVRPIFGDALEAVYGRSADVHGYDFVGKVDPQIVMDLMTAAGLRAREVSAKMPRMREYYARELEARLERAGMLLMPGVIEVLERLGAKPDVITGLLTGNWEPSGRIKLSRFDLNRYLPFGAFGDGQKNRMQLPQVALDRAEEATGFRFEPSQTILVGDSTLDVACAKENGVACLAVGTGWTSAEALEEAGADWVVEDLTHAAGCHRAFK